MVLVVSQADVPEVLRLINEVNGGPVIQMGRVTKAKEGEEPVQVLGTAAAWN
jgi:hypothetical protein